jgi:hypothetical protein
MKQAARATALHAISWCFWSPDYSGLFFLISIVGCPLFYLGWARFMKNTLVAALIAVTAVPLSGCGTICNFAGGIFHPETEPRVYGGVQRDVEVIEKMASAGSLNVRAGSHDPRELLAWIVLLGADPTVSFVADTLTLPITIYVEKRRGDASERSKDSSNLANSAGPATGSVSLGEPRPLDQTGQACLQERNAQQPTQLDFDRAFRCIAPYLLQGIPSREISRDEPATESDAEE